MARPRRALHRAFARFLAQNRSRSAVEVHLTERTDEVWNFTFDGVTSLVSGWINTFEITVAVKWDGACWDLIFDSDAHPVRITDGYVCRICRPSALFPSREALWTDHLFEPFLAWINGTLALSPWLELTGDAGDGVWSARLRRERGDDERPDQPDRELLSIRCVPVRPAACAASRSD